MSDPLHRRIEDIISERKAVAAGISYHDYESGTAWSYHGDRWFHAASTMKVAVLVALFARVEEKAFSLDGRLHVRNRFFSVADGRPYRLSASRDGNEAVYASVGKLMRIRTLAHHMITTSSNLATNLLVDLVGVEWAQEALERFGIRGVELRRGVEDEAAFEQGINNRVTAEGLASLFRLIHEEHAFSEEASRTMREILLQQRFRNRIPAGVPEKIRAETQFAHKTGDMSSVTHDAGIVFLPGREPYIVTILTEWEPDASGRQETVAQISNAVFEHLTETDREEIHG